MTYTATVMPLAALLERYQSAYHNTSWEACFQSTSQKVPTAVAARLPEREVLSCVWLSFDEEGRQWETVGQRSAPGVCVA